MQPFKVELNDMESLLDTYRQIMEKTSQATQSIKKAQEAGTALLIAGAAKDTVYNDSGMYRFSKVIEDFAATARVLNDYTGDSLKQFVDMDKLLAKQMYEMIQKDPKVDPKLKQYIQENPDQASQDMYHMTKDPEGFKQQQEQAQKKREDEANAQAQAQYQAPPAKKATQQTPRKAPKQQVHQTAQQTPIPTVKTEAVHTQKSATLEVKTNNTVVTPEVFFNPKANDGWGMNHKDANTILKEAISFNQPEQSGWKKEVVNDGFMSSAVGEDKSEKAVSTLKVTEEVKMNDALNQFFSSLAEKGSE